MSSKSDKIVVAMAAVMITILLFNIAATPVLSMVKEYDKQLILETAHQKTFRLEGASAWYKSGYSHDGEVTTYVIMHKDYIGTYFITAYCPSECGYNGENYPTGWTTASGEICHRADWEDRLWSPTTCAIDRGIHSFGDMFYIEEFDRVFVAEDTGPGVNGRHLDLFYEEYDDVISFPTGYYAVYSVWYEEVDYYPDGDVILNDIWEVI
jgi:3D (Asp-Asp-Asp) domain-containing protein